MLMSVSATIILMILMTSKAKFISCNNEILIPPQQNQQTKKTKILRCNRDAQRLDVKKLINEYLWNKKPKDCKNKS